MNLHQAAAIEGTDVGPAALIESQIPHRNALRAVRQNAGECRAPLAPVRQIISGLVVVSAFGPMHFHVRKPLLHITHHLRASHVSRPGSSSCAAFPQEDSTVRRTQTDPESR